MNNMLCKLLGHAYEPLAIGHIHATNDTITVYACERCAAMPADNDRQKIERKRMKRGERIEA